MLSGVTSKDDRFAGAVGVPYAHRLVVGNGRHAATVRADRDVFDQIGVPPENERLVSGTSHLHTRAVPVTSLDRMRRPSGLKDTC